MNKKKIILIIGLSLVVIACIVCFTIALINHTNNKSNSETAKDISSKYDEINYGSTSNLSGSTISKGGSYNITGSYSCITINTSDDVELVLDNATITCDNGPAINVVEASTVSVKLVGDSKITSTTTEYLDGAIYSKADLIFSGDGSLTIESNYDGIVSKDTLVIKGGTYTINSSDDGVRGKDNVAIVDGKFTINAKGDGIKSTNEEDATKGYIAIDGGEFTINSVGDGITAETNVVISAGNFNIKTTGNTSSISAKGIKATNQIEINGGTYSIDSTDDGIHSNGNITINNGDITVKSGDDAIHADDLLEVNNGTLNLTAREGLEATYVKVNDGTVYISASDDGINAGNKSNKYTTTIEINGGKINIDMGQGDTDGIDSNGNLYITGGTISINCNSPFDYDGEAKYTGGTIIVNGEETNTITNQMMGGGMGGQGGPRGHYR